MYKTAVFVLALLASEMEHPSTAHAGQLRIPAFEDWSLSFHDEETLTDEAHPYLPAPDRKDTFSMTLAHGLVGYGIGIRHSAVVIGRDLGRGWHVYVGHAFDLSGFGDRHGAGYALGHVTHDSSVGVEYVVHF